MTSRRIDRREPSLQDQPTKKSALDADAVRNAYRRWAGVYDGVFGTVSAAGRRMAVAAANQAEGERVLEVGVGTGLALPHYRPGKRVTGIDLSPDMLDRARTRVARHGLSHVERLEIADAEATPFADGSFDVAVAMFVASVVPHPARLMAEMQRVVRPGGRILFVNHFAADTGPRARIERALGPLSRTLGWHPDFEIGSLLGPAELAVAKRWPVPPAGLFTLVSLPNVVPAAVPRAEPGPATPVTHPEPGCGPLDREEAVGYSDLSQ